MLHIDEKIFNLKLFDRWRRKKVKQMMEKKNVWKPLIYNILYKHTYTQPQILSDSMDWVLVGFWYINKLSRLSTLKNNNLSKILLFWKCVQIIEIYFRFDVWLVFRDMSFDLIVSGFKCRWLWILYCSIGINWVIHIVSKDDTSGQRVG